MAKIYKKIPKGCEVIDYMKNLEQGKKFIHAGYYGYKNLVLVKTGQPFNVMSPYVIVGKRKAREVF